MLVCSSLYFIYSSSLVLSPGSEIAFNSNQDDEAASTDVTIGNGIQADLFTDGKLQGLSNDGKLLDKTIQEVLYNDEKLLAEMIQDVQLQHQQEVDHKQDDAKQEAESKSTSDQGQDNAAGPNNKVEQNHNVGEVKEAEHGNSEGNMDQNEVTVNHVRYIPDSIINNLKESIDTDKVDWLKYAYVQYSTSQDYSCNAIMNFERLRSKYNTKANLVLILTNEASIHFGDTLRNKVEELGVIVKRVNKLTFKSADVTWMQGFTKFYTFDLEEYNRVIYLDSDATILGNMDELFFLPDEVDIAMPLAYDETVHRMKNWFAEFKTEGELDKEFPNCKIKLEEEKNQVELELINEALAEKSKLKEETDATYQSLVYQGLPYLSNEQLFDLYYFSDHFMVVKPSEKVYKELIEMCETKKESEYDMNLINKKFSIKNVLSSKDTELLVLPHRTYGALSGTFRIQAYELLYYTDPTEIQCYARKEFDKELRQKESGQEKGSLKADEAEEVAAEPIKEAALLDNAPGDAPVLDHVNLMENINEETIEKEKTAAQKDDNSMKTSSEEPNIEDGTTISSGSVSGSEEEPNFAANGNNEPETRTTEDGHRRAVELGNSKREVQETERLRLIEEETDKIWGSLKIVHFSDYPIPKPWFEEDRNSYYVENLILCPLEKDEMIMYEDSEYKPRIVEDCAASKYWNGLYRTFRKEREDVCRLSYSSSYKK